MEAICRKCGVKLVDENWWPSNRKQGSLICKTCANQAMLPIYRKYHAKMRMDAVKKIAGSNEVECVYCHCDDIRLLEINHKKGGGRHEFGESNDNNKRRLWKFYQDIISGERPIDDLEITCRVCNARHYLELKYGPLPFTIIWKGKPIP
jgi:hypothetical protein